jgi:hypothetical protein
VGLFGRFARWSRLPPEERRVVLRASLLLLFARLALAGASVAWTRGAAGWLARRSAMPSARVAALVAAAARALPGATGCLPRAIALEALLRRGGHAAELRVGVAPRRGRGRLAAHAWVEVDGVAVGGDPSPYVALPVFGTRP